MTLRSAARCSGANNRHPSGAFATKSAAVRSPSRLLIIR